MNQLYDPSPRPPERVWLHRTQWRTVAGLLLLLAAVVATLALASGFWWATRAQPVRRAKLAAPVAPAPVATVTIPASTASVVEVYPVTVVPTRVPPIVVRSPGGTVAELPVQIGQRVRAGQRLALLEHAKPAVATPRSAPISDADASLARERARAEALRERLDRIRSRIQQVAAASPPPTPAPRPDAERDYRAAEQAEAGVERARRAVALAAERRRVVDQQYADRRVSRFQFHLARYGELVAEVDLRRAEEEMEEARQAVPPPAVVTDTGAVDRQRKRQLARLEVEGHDLETRLARVRLRVAGTRQQIDPSPATPAIEVRAARAPRDGTVTLLLAKPGASLTPGTPLLAIAPVERPRLRVHVDRRELSSLSPGTKVTIRGSDHRFVARVGHVDRQPDGTAVMDLIPPRRARLTSDLVLVPPVPKPLPPRLPTAALIPGGSGTAVWLATRRPDQPGHWIARRRAVHAVPFARNRIAVPVGLRSGDRVIVAGGQRLREGQPVAPVELGSLTTE